MAAGLRKLARQRRPVYAIVAMMVVLLVSGMATGFDLAVKLNYVFGAVLVISFVWAKWGIGRLSVHVDRPKGDLSVGDELHEVITVRNSGGPPRAWIEIEDITDIPNVSLGRVVSLPGIVTFRRVEARAKLVQRGEYTLGPLVIRSADPFGIFPQEKSVADARRIRVYPRILDLPDYVLPSTELSGEHARRRRSPMLSPEVSSIREYEPGDAISRIHWPSTARTGQLMVKLFDRGRAGEVWIVFDQEARVQAGAGRESTDEYGATIAASTAHRYLSMQLPVGYSAHGSESLVMAPERGSGQREAIFEHLVTSKPAGTHPLFNALTDIERELGRNSSLVVITASAQPEWVDAVTSLQKRGVRANVVLLDPATFGGSWSIDDVRLRLLAGGARTFIVKRGASIQAALSEPETMGPRAGMGRRMLLERAR
ncbi:MAG: DUF58 domain-containing protein [Chloroflexi bacterium]|nr:DUF58 domain-containing protein [Chloroflexota bacterium]